MTVAAAGYSVFVLVDVFDCWGHNVVVASYGGWTAVDHVKYYSFNHGAPDE